MTALSQARKLNELKWQWISMVRPIFEPTKNDNYKNATILPMEQTNEPRMLALKRSYSYKYAYTSASLSLSLPLLRIFFLISIHSTWHSSQMLSFALHFVVVIIFYFSLKMTTHSQHMQNRRTHKAPRTYTTIISKRCTVYVNFFHLRNISAIKQLMKKQMNLLLCTGNKTFNECTSHSNWIESNRIGICNIWRGAHVFECLRTHECVRVTHRKWSFAVCMHEC